jgi:aldehyde:ferredoxin oxidoreductase
MHVKGEELALHEPRYKPGMGVGFAISPTGADHCHNMHDPFFAAKSPTFEDMQALGILETVPVKSLSPEKMRILAYFTNWHHFLNSAVCCFFVIISGRIGYDRMASLVKAATGWNISIFELLKIGERAANLARIFNLREGFTVADDSLPERFFKPHASGPLKDYALDHKEFEKAKEWYYGVMDWPNGIPSEGKLTDLGINWAVSCLHTK